MNQPIDSLQRVTAGVTRNLGQIVRGIHIRYLLAFTLSQLIPRFAAGGIIVRLYRFAGFRFHRTSTLGGPLKVIIGAGRPANLEVGVSVLISTDVTINLDGPVHIEENASVGPFVRIYTATHSIGPGSRRCMPQLVPKAVTIQRGAWVGLGATVLPGVTVGSGSIVGAGSVVAADVPPHTYVEGNPASVVRSLPWSDR